MRWSKRSVKGLRTVRDIRHLSGVPVLVRAALNVPIENGAVANSFRLRSALPTIEFLQKKGAKVILIGHLGDKGTETLRPVYESLKTFLPYLTFCPNVVGKEARDAVRSMRSGDVLMLENLRWMKGEKENDPDFAKELASLADLFVEDSFDVCHRKHASVVGVPAFLPSYAGLLVEAEVAELTRALKPKQPSLAVIAGAKFSTKEPVIVSLLRSYARVFVGGALANDFIQEEGNAVGVSLTSDGDRDGIKKLLRNEQLLVPRDVIVAKPGAPAEEGNVVAVTEIPSNVAALDIGPGSIDALAPYIKKAKTILWNGTLGQYEAGYIQSTEKLARMIAASKAHSIIGGGDTVAALESIGITKKFSFVSTGGGAMLDFLAYGGLPGVDVLMQSAAHGSVQR